MISILIVFAALRRLIEPSCPACSAKSWGEGPGALNCAKCGWTNALEAAAEKSQYEMSLLEKRGREVGLRREVNPSAAVSHAALPA